MREGTRTSLPSPPLLFIAFSTPHRSPLSERLEQARITASKKLERFRIYYELGLVFQKLATLKTLVRPGRIFQWLFKR